MTQAAWFVPSISNVDNLPEGFFITMFDAKNHVNGGLTSAQIKQEYEQNAKSVGEYVLCLSPERLALHETIVAMATTLKFQSEDDFIEKFHKIYKEAVLPKIKEKEDDFSKRSVLRRQSVEENAVLFFKDSNNPAIQHLEDFKHYSARFTYNLERYNQRISELTEQFKQARPSRQEREEIKQLNKIVAFMNENKERIIVDLVVNAETLRENKQTVEKIISGAGGVFNSPYIQQFDKLTQHDKNTRQAFLIVGGAASGKGSVTLAVKNEQSDRNDLLEINPDLYKKLLLPFEEVKGHIELHGSLTHAESSIVFDSIADRWQRMAKQNKAPNILMDVARAGNWQLSVLGTGNTQISANTPMLPILTALERSYKRGEQTGRFMPTKELIQGHKEQVLLNKNAMKRGVNYRFYNTNVKFGAPTPLVANFEAKKSQMTIYDMGVMWDYFSKSQLNPDARSAEDLSFASPKTTAKEMVNHAEFMDIVIQDKEDLLFALAQKNGKIICKLKDFSKLIDNMGKENALNMLIGLKQNGVQIEADKQVLELIDKEIAQNSNNPKQKNIKKIDITCQQYADLLERLVSDGVRVGKTENAYIYDFANDEDLKDKKLIIGTQNLDIISEEASMQSYNEYDPSQESKRQKLLIIDPKVYNTPQKREQLIQEMRKSLKETGRFEAEGIYMNERRKVSDDYLFDNSKTGAIQVAKPNPDAVRVAYKIEDKAVKIPTQWGEYIIEKDGSIVVREKDMAELKRALSDYQKDNNPTHLLNADGKAKIDVYGTDPFFIEDNYSYIFSEAEYRKGVDKLLAEGRIMDPKNSTKYEPVVARQIGKDEKIVLPDGSLLKAGDWLCLPVNEISNIQKQLDTDQPITGVYSIKQNTMQKSYRSSKKTGRLAEAIQKAANTTTQNQQQSLLNVLSTHMQAKKKEEENQHTTSVLKPSSARPAKTPEREKKIKELLTILKKRETALSKQQSSALKKEDLNPR